MMFQPSFVQWLDHWQTLATGILALIAAGGTVWGTIYAARLEIDATIKAADRQIDATKQAAQLQVDAAMAQVKEAQRQSEEARRGEAIRNASERKSAAEMLHNSMAYMAIQTSAQLVRVGQQPSNNVFTSPAHTFKAVGRPNFDFVRLHIRALGSDTALRFFQLDTLLDNLTEEVQPALSVGAMQDHLRDIAAMVADLNDGAEKVIARAEAVISGVQLF